MKKLYLLLFFLLLVAFGSFAQTSTETFADEVEKSTTFTDNGQQFTISSQSGGTFQIRDRPTNAGGYNDDYYITNDFFSDNAPPQFTIATSNNEKFRLKSFYLTGYYAASVTITGKLGASTVFTATVPYSYIPNYGLIDLATTFAPQNYSNAVIDSYTISSTASNSYVLFLDNMTWQKTGINPSVSSLPTFYVCPGNTAPSDYKSFVVSGTLLTNNLVVTAPTGYQVAVNVGGWGNSMPLAQSGGTVNPFTIYVRVAPNAGGTPAGNITLSSTGSPSMYIAVNSANTTITAPPNRTVCPNNTTTFPVTVTGATSYQWQGSIDGGTTYSNLLNNAPYSGVTTNVLTVTGITAGMNGYKYRVAASNGTCAVNSIAGTLTVSTVTIASTQTDPSCSGSYDGSISATPSGGTAPYSYSWSFNGYRGANLVGVPANNYSVTVTDSNGCTATKTFTLTAPIVTGTTITSPASCYGGSTGYIDLTPSGGTGPYTFLWNNGATSEDRISLTAGTYSVTIKDTNGCTGTISNIVVGQATAVTGTTITSPASCYGDSNGYINLTPSGGTGPYTFLWNNGATSEDRTGLLAGTYSVTITDSNGCIGTVSNIAVTQPNAAVTGTTLIVNSCYGQNNGSINLTPSGGTPGYTYNWGGGITTEDRTGLAAGTYICIITDANSCEAEVSAIVQSGTQISGSTITTNVSCFGDSTGAINLTPSGGTPGYTYNWGGGITTEDRTGLTAGTYTCTITDSKGCTGTVTVNVSQPSAPVSGTVLVTNQSCFGINTGSIDLTPTGGSSGYIYNWGGGINTQDRIGLAPGTYTCIITDMSGCEGTVTATVLPATQIIASTAIVQPTCFGGNDGSVNLTVSGGTLPYSFSWSDSATTEDRTGIAAGTYSVTITDGNNCSATFSVIVGTPAIVTGTTVVTAVKCFGGATGSINLTPSGGTAPYTFLWNAGAATEDRTGLTAGSYSVTITDSKGCTGTVSAIIVTQPFALTASGTQTNVSCHNGSNGSATVSVTGGTGSYTYSWAPSGGSGASASGLASGTYTVTIKDGNLCETTYAFDITQPSVLTATDTQTNVLCFSGSNGSATINATGGTGTYTYLWNTIPAQTTATASALAAGIYSVRVRDANLCEINHSFTITEPAVLSTSGSQVNVTCNGGSNGSATVDVTGGTGTYTYLWLSSGATTATVSGLTAGIYDVWVRDANLCGTIQSFTITEPTRLTATTTQANVLCNGGTGLATVTATGGTTGYTYSWSTNPVQTTATATGLITGTYNVLVTDANGCTVTKSVTITQPAVLTAITTQANVLCNGGTGTATVIATGGTTGYTYLWDTVPAQTTATAISLVAGTYNVVVTDANGCTVTKSVTITQPTALAASTAQSNILCNGSTGYAIVAVSGGTGTYTYLWNTIPAQTTAMGTGLSAGTYSVIVTDTNGCSITKSVTITQPTVLTATTTQVNVLCNGGMGSATVTATGGTMGYTYSWSTLPTQNTATATGITAGTYNVIVTDANGCSIIKWVTITQPAVLAATTSQVNILCNGGTGSATVTATGGTTSYTYLWNSIPAQTSATATGLVAGLYNVVVTDANGCFITKSVTITQPTVLEATTSQVNVLCNGGTGSATVTATGGTTSYTYLWNSIPAQTSAIATGLIAGTYNVVVTDANGCSVTKSVTITQPAVLTASTTKVNVLCNSGTGLATVIVSGGTTGYTYTWSTTPVQTTATATGLSAGPYNVVVTDTNGCYIIKTVNITQPTVLEATTTQDNVLCNGGTGSATVTATGGTTGGTTGYTYLWDTVPAQTTPTATGLIAGTYNVVVTDANGCSITKSVIIIQPAVLEATTTQVNILCNGGTGSATVTATGGTQGYTYLWNSIPAQTSAIATGLTAGSYNVVVTDANGCSVTKSVTITQPAVLTATTSQVNVLCNGSTGSATVIVSGGTTGYTYAWSTIPVQTSAMATGLTAGNYNVVVTDANGCSITKSVIIIQPAVLEATTTQVNILCNGGTGSATVTATGGTSGYTYAWSTIPVQTLATATGLIAGSYNVVVTDDNGCTVTKSVTITQPTVLIATTTQANVLCNGGTGSATVIVSGGTTGYTYSWSTTPVQTTATATGLSAGPYNVVVMDANGCFITKSVTITQPAVLTATITQNNVLCYGGTGSATVIVSGGTTGYTYSWSTTPVQTTATATGLIAGPYNVIVTDINGCYIIKTVNITQPTVLTATTTQVNILCNSGTGSATVTATGGTPGYPYLWNSIPAQTSATATGLVAGPYTVVVTDANGCFITKSVTITEPAVLTTSGIQTNILCFGNATGSATVTATGGTAPYSYLWSDDHTAAINTGLIQGTYSVTVTDINGCSTVQSFIITEPSPLVSSTSHTDALCNGTPNGSAEIIVSGGTVPYTYLWSDGNSMAMASNLTAGTYTVNVTDANGCSISEEVVINQPLAIMIDAQPVDVSTTTGNNAQFTAITANANSYQWLVSDDGENWTAIIDGGTNPAYSGAATDTLTLENVSTEFNGYLYRLQLTNGTDCQAFSDIAILTVSNILLAVNDDFSAAVLLEGTEGIAGNVTANDLFNNQTVNNTNITVAVIDNGGLTGAAIDDEGNLIIPATDTNGTYTITYQICDAASETNCSTAQAIVVISPVAGNHEVKDIQFTLYPNPASSEVFIKLYDFTAYNNLKAAIYDLNGRLVKDVTISTETLSIDVSALESAVYILNIISDTAKATKRIVVDKKP